MRLLDAIDRKPLDRPPIWFMRQAGRYLPEYQALRSEYSFSEAVHNPAVATEITLQPVRRFGLDAAIVFADIMTPLEALGIPIEFTPGPTLDPLPLEAIVELPDLDPESVSGVAETVAAVREALDPNVAVIGFAGAPFTLLVYLLEGGGSKTFAVARAELRRRPDLAEQALGRLAAAMQTYLGVQIGAGANVVQLFDSWVGLLPVDQFVTLAGPAADRSLASLPAPAIYFAPHGPHLLRYLETVQADVYGVDWRLPLDEAWLQIGVDTPIQGNLDPAVLLTDPETVRAATREVLGRAGDWPGHIFNLGHGILPTTSVENVEAMVAAVKEYR